MASVTFAARRCVSFRVPCLAKCPALVKQMHASLPTRHASGNSDLLGILDEPASQTTSPTSAQSPPEHANTRERKFYELLDFVRDRTGREKIVKAGQVRTTAWLRLFQLASKPEHLEAVAGIFPRWRESRKVFTPLDTEMFVRRCEELDCPQLALKIIGDHPKYGLALSSLPAARTLLHALYRKYPLEDVVSTVSLMGMNNLPSATTDPASCAMLYAACLRSENRHASLLGRDVRMALQKLLRHTPPFPEPREKLLRARYTVKPDLWLLEALRDIKKTKKDQGRGSWWITEWVAKGEGRELPPLAQRRYQATPEKRSQVDSPPATSNVPCQFHA